MSVSLLSSLLSTTCAAVCILSAHSSVNVQNWGWTTIQGTLGQERISQKWLITAPQATATKEQVYYPIHHHKYKPAFTRPMIPIESIQKSECEVRWESRGIDVFFRLVSRQRRVGLSLVVGWPFSVSQIPLTLL